jgi:hypothetical protein
MNRTVYFRVHEAGNCTGHNEDGIYISPCTHVGSVNGEVSQMIFEHCRGGLGVWSWRDWEKVKLLMECHGFEVVLENPHGYGLEDEEEG